MKLLRFVCSFCVFAFATTVVAFAAQSDRVIHVNPHPESQKQSSQPSAGPFSLLGATTYTLPGIGPDSLTVADVNGDGKLDLVVASQCESESRSRNCPGTGQVSVLLGNGDGTFQPPVAYSTGAPKAPATSVAVADVNRDGKPDIVVAIDCRRDNYGACKDDGQLSVLLGNGDGTFQTAMTYDSGGRGAESVAIGDLRGNGIPDLVVADESQSLAKTNGAVSVLLGNGDGTFHKATDYDSGGYGAVHVGLADLRGVGILDAIVDNECENDLDCDIGSVSVLLGNGDGTFQPAVPYTPGGQIASIAVADLNSDGIPDLIAFTQFDSPLRRRTLPERNAGQW